MSALEIHTLNAYETQLLAADRRAHLLRAAGADRLGSVRRPRWFRRHRRGPVTLTDVLVDVRPALRSVSKDRGARLEHLGNALMTEVIDAAVTAGVQLPLHVEADLASVSTLSLAGRGSVVIDEDRARVIHLLVKAVEQAALADQAVA